MCNVYTGYCGTSETEHGLCACTVDNPRAKARGLSLRTGPQTMLYLSQTFTAAAVHVKPPSFVTILINDRGPELMSNVLKNKAASVVE